MINKDIDKEDIQSNYLNKNLFLNSVEKLSKSDCLFILNIFQDEMQKMYHDNEELRKRLESNEDRYTDHLLKVKLDLFEGEKTIKLLKMNDYHSLSNNNDKTKYKEKKNLKYLLFLTTLFSYICFFFIIFYID